MPRVGLLPPMKKWSVEYDGPSRPIIFTPDNRMLSLSQWENGRWVSYEQEIADCNAFVKAMNGG